MDLPNGRKNKTNVYELPKLKVLHTRYNVHMNKKEPGQGKGCVSKQLGMF